MAHHSTEKELSPAESKYEEIITRADDFFKIQLLRQAKSWYRQAHELNPEDEYAKQRMEECEKLLAHENRVVYILLAIAAVVILAYIFLVK